MWIQQAVRTGRVDLRKVLGESNPADLLTKHSLSRQRLDNLVTLFGCRHSGGRAESAPQIRKGGPSKTTMAQADKDICAARGLSAVLEGVGPSESTEEETSPLMPHLTYSPSELDVLYPKLQAPEDGQLDDAQDDVQDGVTEGTLTKDRPFPYAPCDQVTVSGLKTASGKSPRISPNAELAAHTVVVEAD